MNDENIRYNHFTLYKFSLFSFEFIRRQYKLALLREEVISNSFFKT